MPAPPRAVARSSRLSRNRTAWWRGVESRRGEFTMAASASICSLSDPETGQNSLVFFADGLGPHLDLELVPVPDIEIALVPQHRHITRHLGGFPEERLDHHAPLRIEASGAPVVVHAVQEAHNRGVHGRDGCYFFLDFQPDGHRINPDVLSGQAGDEHVLAVLLLDVVSERGGDLQATLLVDPGWGIAPEHALASKEKAGRGRPGSTLIPESFRARRVVSILRKLVGDKATWVVCSTPVHFAPRARIILKDSGECQEKRLQV